VFFLACSLLLFGYSAYRACHLSFTHDESLSYMIVAFNADWYFTANNHPLNTRLMRWCLHWLSDREWALRLPNVASHVLYLSFGFLLLMELKDTSLMLVGFALLNLNTFLLDFFSLARGYGLALGLSLGAFYCFKRAWDRHFSGQIFFWVTAGLTFAAYATLANFAWINCYLALLVCTFVLLFIERKTFAVRRHLFLPVLLAGGNAWFIFNLVKRLAVLAKNGQFYAGGEKGFFRDTIYSLVDFELYQKSPATQWIWPLIVLICGLLLGLGATALWQSAQRRQLGFSALLLLVLMLITAALIAEHVLLNSRYPTDRGALYYVPITALLIVFACDEILGKSELLCIFIRVMTGVLCAAVVFHFTETANLAHTYVWWYDADTKKAVAEMDGLFNHGNNVKVGSYWALEPSMNYYRLSRHYEWLLPITRYHLSSSDNDAIYCFANDIRALPSGFSLVKTFPDSGGLLLVNEKSR